MRVLIDADGCPVVDIVLKEANRLNIECLIFCDAAHVIERPDAETITVSTGADSVDFALVNKLRPGDIVVTQDYGLAAMCLAKLARPLNQNGMRYTKENIDQLLLSRHIAKKIRRSGGRLKGPGKRKKEWDERFTDSFRKLLEEEI